MMPLDQLLAGLDVGVVAFALCEVRGRASLVFEDDETASIHYVLAGKGSARAAGARFNLAPHSVIIAPSGGRVVFSCGDKDGLQQPEPHCQPLPGGWEKMTVGQGAGNNAGDDAGINDGPLILACGGLSAVHSHGRGLFEELQEPLVLSVAEDSSFREPFRRLLSELAAPLPGTRSLAELLMKECLISLLRRYCESGGCDIPWLAALANPRLAPAVTAILEKPEAPHSLQSLADLAGMSRSAFSEHFRDAFGRSAIDFLKEVRLRRAARLLHSSDLPVKAIAHRVGFASRSYFSRAFKAEMGVDPAGYRQRGF
jgi:AraC family transcriptional activator of mtrCDE